MGDSYKSIREHQTTIFYIINYRYLTLRYLYDEYNENNKGTYSQFIIDTMHVYKQCIVIDLCKLFKSKETAGNEQCSFYRNIKNYRTDIGEEKYDIILKILKSCQDDVTAITYERNKNLAHRDIKKRPEHRLHLDNMDTIDRLVNHAKTILDIFWDSAYEFESKSDESVSEIIELIRKDRQDWEDNLIDNLRNKR